MSDSTPGRNSLAITFMHELGHAAHNLDVRAGRNPRDTSNERALEFENAVRTLDDPTAPYRKVH
jgi:hypothetical protein